MLERLAKAFTYSTNKVANAEAKGWHHRLIIKLFRAIDLDLEINCLGQMNLEGVSSVCS
jgi:hypothetical protein